MKTRTLTLLALVLGATACSVRVDTQYGLRLAPPAVRNPKAHDDPATKHESVAVAARTEPSPVEDPDAHLAAWNSATPWIAAPAEAPSEAALSPVDQEPLTAAPAPGTHGAPLFATQPHDAATTNELEVIETRSEPLPLWAESLLGILLALVAIGLVGLGGMASVLAVVSFGFGDVAFAWLMVAAALAGLVGGYLVYRLARPMLPELNFYWLSNPIVRLVLGIVSLVFFLLTFGI